MISVEQARQFLHQQLLDKNLPLKPEIITVELQQAVNLVLAEDIISPLDVPPADNSAMDGYAVQLASIVRGRAYDISNRIIAGDESGVLTGVVARIFTGAEIPAGADTVVIQEDASTDDGQVVFNHLPALGSNIRRKGQDIYKDQRVLRQGERLTAAKLGLLASLGVERVSVFRPLKVAVLSSGNELVSAGRPLKSGQIYNSNAVLLKTLLENDSFDCVSCVHVVDDKAETEQKINELLDNVDVLLCTGGVSVGEEDYVGHALQDMGEMFFWKLAIKPGKPLAFAKVAEKFCFGLPGNPVSGFVTYQIIVRSFLRRLQGEADFSLQFIQVPVAQRIQTGKREEYFRASLTEELGTTKLSLYENQSSGVLSSVAFSDGLLRVPANTELQPGDMADFLLLR